MFAIKMAKRYITKQKRHSLLTVCSIAAALALITMLFCGFFTVMNCAKDISRAEKPYHLQISDITKEELGTLREYTEERAGKPDIFVTEQEDGLLTARLTFTEYIGDSMFNDPGYLPDLMLRLRGGQASSTANESLIFLDLIDLDGRANFAVIFALFYVFANLFIIMLRLIIDAAFEISSKERERQFGVLQSVGATPLQIVKIITAEGLMLSAAGIPIGVLAGIGLAYGGYKAVVRTGFLFTPQQLEYVRFRVSPIFILIAAATGLMWVYFSASGTGMRVINMSPIEAISGRGNKVKKVGKHSLLGAVFGWKGKLAARNNFRQAKRFVITVLSLTISITMFAGMETVNLIGDMVITEINDTYYTLSEEYEVHDLALSFDGRDGTSYRDTLEMLENSSYFKNVSLRFYRSSIFEMPDGRGFFILLLYMNRYEYEKYFDGTPPLSYDELARENALVLMENANSAELPEDVLNGERLHYSEKYNYAYSPEEYEELPEEEKAQCVPDYEFFNREKSEEVYYYYRKFFYEKDMKIAAKVPVEKNDFYHTIFVGTLDSYDELCAEFGRRDYYAGISCDIAEEEYYEDAIELIRGDRNLSVQTNYFAETRRAAAEKAAVRIAVAFLTACVAVVAAVNMINIISTGILNRKSELAAMGCIGMTEGQLYGMTVIECLQYSLTAGIFSTALALLLIFGTNRFVIEEVGDELFDRFSLSYSSAVIKVWLSALAAFAAALCASLVPLWSVRKKALVDMIRKAE